MASSGNETQQASRAEESARTVELPRVEVAGANGATAAAAAGATLAGEGVTRAAAGQPAATASATASAAPAAPEATATYVNATAADIARYNLGSVDALEMPAQRRSLGTALHQWVSAATTGAHMKAERWTLRGKVIFCMIILAELVFVSLGITGAAGQYYPYSGAYATYDPLQIANALGERAYNFFGPLLHMWGSHDNTWIMENVPGYWAIWNRLGVVGITLLCAILLAVSGMLYQNVFKNPIAGPGMLGVGSGVSLGMMIMVALYGASATSMLGERYAYCYGLGAAILLFVIVGGRKLSGKGRPFDTVTMMLVGSILSQLLGFVVSYITLFVMTEDDYLTFYNLSQMLTIDTSLISWAALGVAFLLSFIPVWLMRFKLNALAFEEEEVRMMGLDAGRLRGLALICGAIMILAAQVHTGMVSMVSLIVPFLSRSWFGVEFRKQLAGNICIGTILLLACRDITDLIPFVGDGLAIGSIVSVCAMPLFVVIMARQLRGWE